MELPDRAATVFEVIKGRRSIRDFDIKEIPDEHLRIILEAGIWAPSGSNMQPWEFILIKDRELLERVKLFSPGLFGRPAAVVIICINRKISERAGKLSELMPVMDISMAAQNMMLMAYALGIGSCPVVSFNKAALRELLNIPPHIEPMLMVTLGYPKEMPKPPKRRPLEEVVHVDGFQ
ncbi:MAG: nitroreductase family protein [Candidatus Korarchaeum sp.]|nr:nitroreductase family protein [Candidatus Korarchaeum sp.]